VAPAPKRVARSRPKDSSCTAALATALAQPLARQKPLPLKLVAAHDRFGKSGTPDQLMEKYKLTEAAIVAAVEAVVKRRK